MGFTICSKITLRDWSKEEGGGGASEVLPLRKGGTQGLARLKGGGHKRFPHFKSGGTKSFTPS